MMRGAVSKTAPDMNSFPPALFKLTREGFKEDRGGQRLRPCWQQPWQSAANILYLLLFCIAAERFSGEAC